MQRRTLKQIKEEFAEENFKRIYEDKTIEEIIREINPYKFKESLMPLYVEEFYKAICEFINFGDFIVPTLYEKFLNGSNSNEFFSWFKKDIEKIFFAKTTEM